ncbi:hypothetical protein NMY22_g17729 [Coprinellus aureogranulatus]|nr:hypothetical protein NMY22_g17729 [Coprinellus aureogranulatus]
MEDAKMELWELSVDHVEGLVKQLFELEQLWHAQTNDIRPNQRWSHWRRWYHQVAAGSAALRETVADGRLTNARLISWNPKEPWGPGSLFFRSLDTCRLLPVESAVFQVNLYASAHTWDY